MLLVRLRIRFNTPMILIISQFNQICWISKIIVTLCKILCNKNWILVFRFFIVTLKNSKLKNIELISNKLSKLWKVNFLNFRSNLLEKRLDDLVMTHFRQLNTPRYWIKLFVKKNLKPSWKTNKRLANFKIKVAGIYLLLFRDKLGTDKHTMNNRTINLTKIKLEYTF